MAEDDELVFHFRPDVPPVLPSPGEVVEIRDASGETLAYALVTETDGERLSAISSPPADGLPARPS